MQKAVVILAVVALLVIGLVFINQLSPDRMTENRADAMEQAQQDLDQADALEDEINDGNAADENTVHFKLETSEGDVVIELYRDWAPLGVQRVIDATEAGVYDEARFFRVIPGFVVQFGMPCDPELSAKWSNSNIQDEPVKTPNVRGTVTFAKTQLPNTRSTQLFINLADNTNLDGMGFAPIGKVVEGMDVVERFESKYGGAASDQQPRIEAEGNEYLNRAFPDLDYIEKATIVTP